MALCNMSASESFGIVLLEAWLAGTPVIANKNCAAFHDLAVDGENATLVDSHELLLALKNLMNDYEFSKGLALKGRDIPKNYSWDNISKSFLGICLANVRLKGN
jgi:glycosyltransferase involved in cell wall biosynthesis